MSKYLAIKNREYHTLGQLETTMWNEVFFAKGGRSDVVYVNVFVVITDGKDILGFDMIDSSSFGRSWSIKQARRFERANGVKNRLHEIIKERFLDEFEIAKGEVSAKELEVISMNSAYISQDRKNCYALYYLKLPHNKPFGLSFKGQGECLQVDFAEIGVVSQTTGNLDLSSRVLAALLLTNQVEFPVADNYWNREEL